MLDDLRMFARFAAGLGGFLRQRTSVEECRRGLEQGLARREESFLNVVERAIYRCPGSPYRALLEWAGVTLGDLAILVRKEGIEATLERLCDAGVYLSLEEFKGRQPVRRNGLEIQAGERDNPLLARHFEARTGGSRSLGRRVVIDFGLLAHDALVHGLFLHAADLLRSPMAIWRSVPPGSAGLKRCLMHAKLGLRMERWFTQNKWGLRSGSPKSFLFTAGAVYGSRLLGNPLPVPEYTPLAEAGRVARWLAAKRQDGSPAHLDTNVSSAIRVCQAASQLGLDIAGSFLRLGGEPLTPSRVGIIQELGCRVFCHYSLGEVGTAGVGCVDRTQPDEVHLLLDKLAIIPRLRVAGDSGRRVESLHLTTLLPIGPKIMLNVDSGDCGVLETRRCACPFGQLGFQRHIHSLRSYEKLTSEGMQFLGLDFLTLFEEILPRTFGGNPTDYQFVEDDREGLPQVSLFVSPRLGPLDERQLVQTVLSFLGSRSRGDRMMAERWQQGRTLEVVRQDPLTTPASKILALHVRRP